LAFCIAAELLVDVELGDDDGELVDGDADDELWDEAAGCCVSDVVCCAVAGTINAAASGNVNSTAFLIGNFLRTWYIVSLPARSWMPQLRSKRRPL
jgi:hypothetical protein